MTTKTKTTKTKTTAKTTAKTKATKAEKPKAQSDLRQPQLRVLGILATLAKTKEPLTRAEIAKRAKVDQAWLTEYIGSADKKVRAKNDKKFRSLLTLGYVKAVETEGATTYTITAAGRKAVK